MNSTTINLGQNFASGDFIAYNHNAASKHRIRVLANGQTTYFTSSLSKDEAVKIAVTATSTSVSTFMNGNLISSETINGNWSLADRFDTVINELLGIIPLKQYMLFPTALSDDQCIALTQN